MTPNTMLFLLTHPREIKAVREFSTGAHPNRIYGYVCTDDPVDLNDRYGIMYNEEFMIIKQHSEYIMGHGGKWLSFQTEKEAVSFLAELWIKKRNEER